MTLKANFEDSSFTRVFRGDATGCSLGSAVIGLCSDPQDTARTMMAIVLLSPVRNQMQAIESCEQDWNAGCAQVLTYSLECHQTACVTVVHIEFRPMLSAGDKTHTGVQLSSQRL